MPKSKKEQNEIARNSLVYQWTLLDLNLRLLGYLIVEIIFRKNRDIKKQIILLKNSIKKIKKNPRTIFYA